ncbi:MAG: hypothetical protein JWP61_2767 [Friedmanniella sp.]|nr:hypothetical protein [Friedmanniella sp.]
MLVAAALGVLAALYLAAFLVAGDRAPRDAAVAGVRVGGMTRDQAEAALTTGLRDRALAPVPVLVHGRATTVAPADAGLRVDVPASVTAAGAGRSLSPAHIVGVLTGGADVAPELAVDQETLRAATAALAAQVNTKPRDAALTYAGTTVKRTAARSGVQLDEDGAGRALQDGYLTSTGPVELPSTVTEPAVTTAEADQVATAYAKPAVSGAIRVSAGRAGTFSVSPAMVASSLTFAVQDGTLVPRLDAERLRRAAADAVDRVESTRPRDATVALVKGRPTVVPAVDGTTVSADALAKAVEPALTRKGSDRTGTVALTGAAAPFTTADAEKLGIKEVTGEFTTHFPYLPYRNTNLGRAAELINGTVLKPGETFSLNKVVGERTKANGFVEGFIINGGKFRKELGGGVSQSATTTYNAMFFAGLKDIEHQPHTLYIDRYPPGREATVAWPTLDMRFQNDTRYGVLVQASVVKGTPSRQGSITVRMWSTKTYDKVVSTTPVKSGFTTGRDLKDPSPQCEPMTPVPGFDADYQRLFYRDGAVVRRESFHWRYAPTDHVTCV